MPPSTSAEPGSLARKDGLSEHANKPEHVFSKRSIEGSEYAMDQFMRENQGAFGTAPWVPVWTFAKSYSSKLETRVHAGRGRDDVSDRNLSTRFSSSSHVRNTSAAYPYISGVSEASKTSLHGLSIQSKATALSRRKQISLLEDNVEDVLQNLKQYVINTGDIGILELLANDIFLLASGQELSPGLSNTAFSSTFPHSRIHTSNNANSQPQESDGRNSQTISNDEQNNDTSGVDIASLNDEETNLINEARLRCPLFFSRSQARCTTTHKYPRDIVRHLRTHSHFVCKKCLTSFGTQAELQGHICDKVCAHRGCLQSPSQGHEHKVGCAHFWTNRDTQLKWYTLFDQVVPRVRRPKWRFVIVPVANTLGSVSDIAHDAQVQMPVHTGRSPSFSPFAAAAGASSTTLAPEYQPAQINPEEVDDRIDDIRQQLSTLIGGSRQQNNVILANEETIAQQNAHIRQLRFEVNGLTQVRQQQASVINNLQAEVRATRATNELLHGRVDQAEAANANLQTQLNILRNVLLSFVQSGRQSDQSGAPNQMDLSG